ncbi:glycosyltransferase involved in cell wall biosynthesis [Mucilaginibacter sp. UYP25]|uniref:glycosyltransferase family 2 protein n=1 Tax=unclassified Mucilaginibacter TaxID=2617802 RepID=UPI00339861A0
MVKPVGSGISVIICCYNGATQLPQTLRHLALQVVSPAINWEVIVIDNASTDDTFTVASAEWQQYDLPNIDFTVLSETRPRKYHALSTGVDKAKYEYIVICDDDNWLSNNYINEAFQIINSNPLLAAVGGQGIAVSDIDIPVWFWDCQNSYAVGKPNASSADITAKGYLWGAGMILRRSLYKEVNRDLPAILLGPSQNETARAEDIELCMRFVLAGYRLYYDEALVFSHYILPNRLAEGYKDGLLKINQYQELVLNLYRKQIAINRLSATKKCILLCTSLIRFSICKIFPRIKKWHYAYEAETIFLTNGCKLAEVSDEAIKIKQLSLNLSKKTIV